MNLNLTNKKVLVTGGCHGIGLAICKELEAEGCVVTSVCRCKGYDLFRIEVITRLIYDTTMEYDILVNNVGGGGTWKAVDWDNVWQKNVTPMVWLTYGVLPYMQRQRWGRVITIASIYGKEAGGTPGFTMAKAAEIAFMKSLAIDEALIENNITFNTVAPGAIFIKDKKLVEYKRYGQPEDVASIVAFLCSDKAKWINGACITVDNGFSRSF